jgi:hypothetical protein
VKPRAENVFRSDASDRNLKASSGLVAAVAGTLRSISAVNEVRVLHRDGERSKFFILLDKLNASTVQAVVQTMVQIEDAFAPEQFDYDTIGLPSATLVPTAARVVAPTA